MVYPQILAVIRSSLDDSTFTITGATGQRMTLEQAVAYALEGVDSAAKEEGREIP